MLARSKRRGVGSGRGTWSTRRDSALRHGSAGLSCGDPLVAAWGSPRGGEAGSEFGRVMEGLLTRALVPFVVELLVLRGDLVDVVSCDAEQARLHSVLIWISDDSDR